ncbi:ABC transporter permease [Chelatococcus asaccharovorans]|uniref:ABC transporter permease n=1 Tax=Chelatococcus asaccharovorans TaxID=28210 RepID=UPI002264CC8F|nr:iron ABC transporter permease [Chelatococcus asaccharovorans]
MTHIQTRNASVSALPRLWLRQPLGQGNVLAFVLVVVLALLVLPPLLVLLRISFTEFHAGFREGGFTFQHYVGLIQSNTLFRSTVNSVLFAALSTVISLIFGGILAWLVERTDVRFKPLAFLTSVVSMGTPYILYVTGWLFLLGKAGPLNRTWFELTGSPANLFEVNSLAGMVLVEGFLWSPLVFLLLSATFRAANAEMEEAARMSGASVADTILRVSFQLARPAIVALALFVFIRNLEAFEVPALVGIPGNVSVLTTEIYRGMKHMPPDIGFVSAYAMVMVAVIAILLHYYGKLSDRAERFASITGKGFRPRPFRLGRLRWLGGGIILFNFFIVLVLPLGAIFWMSVLPFVQPIRPSAFRAITWENYQRVLTDSYYWGLAGNTLIVAGTVATLVVALTFLTGWVVARRKRGARIIDQLVTVPLVFPGLVLGIAMLQLALRAPVPIYGTLWIIILGFIIRYVPYGMRYSFSGVLQIHTELEQAAAVSGANTREMLFKVVAPLLVPALASGWIFVFLIATKEMSMPLLLAGAQSQTIPVAMFELWTSGQSGEVAALGLIWAAAMTVLSASFYALTRQASAATFGK